MKLVRKFSLLLSMLFLLPLTATSMEKQVNFDDQIKAQNSVVLAMNDTSKAGGDKLYIRRPFFNPFLFSPYQQYCYPYDYCPYGIYPYSSFSYPLYFQFNGGRRHWDGGGHNWRRH
ncbi:MAG: hypothetical protein ACHQYQ_10025 [Bacteriovoracales bacterium]